MEADITPPKLITKPPPFYPDVARWARIEGRVIIEIVVDEEGTVYRDARVLRSIPALNQPAIDAVRRWRFEPARLDGEPVPVVATVTVDFHLN